VSAENPRAVAMDARPGKTLARRQVGI